MRTTLEIDDDVLMAAKELAARENVSTGKKISDLARCSLSNPKSPNDHVERVRNGVPIITTGEQVVTTDLVNRILEDEGA